MSAVDETARIVLDHVYDAVWRLMQMRNQVAGVPPWPEDARDAAQVVMAATVGYLSNSADQIGEGEQFRQMLVQVVASETGA
jgi:CO/xanthine dehydrogenase FAD-binding subunit